MAPDGPEPDARTLPRLTGEWHGLTLPHGGAETAPAAPLAADAVPGYELLGEVGRGGMGVVYRARHLGLNRIVALKMVLAGAHARGADLQRFRAEAEAIARLQHPNVVQVYDVGEANGLPYLSLELCAGSLADRLDGTPWPPGPAAELVETLAGAVHAAHQAGVLHRDIKPANVLMASRARERAEGDVEKEPPVAHASGSPGLIPKITDFGLAKRIDGSGAGPTATGAILGTPSYMAPEQAGRATGDGKAASAGPAIDVYALGAILYELLTGRPPFLASSPLDTLLQITRDEPIPPARLNPKTPRDIQTICLKCLEKEPARRYSTAAALGDDLRRYLTNEPITARPAARWERAWKWAKRRPAQAGLVAVSVAAVIALVAGSWYFTGQLQVERDNAMWAMDNAKISAAAAFENAQLAGKNAERAKAEALNARRQSYVLAMGQAQLAWQSAAVDRLKNLLRGQVSPAVEDDLRGFEWHYWNHVTRGAPREFGPVKLEGRVYRGFGAVAYSPDGRQVVATTNAGQAFLWDVATGRLERAFSLTAGNATVAFRPDGRQIAFGNIKGVRVVDAASGDAVWRVEQPEWIGGLAYTPDGNRLVVKYRGLTRVYAAAGGRILATFVQSIPQSGGVAVSPDGRRIATGGFPNQIVDIDTGQVVRDLTAGNSVAFSPDGARLAVVANDGDTMNAELRVVGVATGQVVARSRAHSEFEAAVAYGPDGKYIATAGNDNTTRLWDSATGKEVRRFQGGSRLNNAVAFSPDGRSLAVATGGLVEIWPVDFDQEATTLKAHKTLGTSSLALSAETARVLGAGVFGGQIADTAAETTANLSGRSRGALCAAFSADGALVAAGFNDGAVTIWDAKTGNRVRDLIGLRQHVIAVAISADGRRLAAAVRPDLAADGSFRPRPANEPDRVVVWDVASGAVVRDLAGADVEQVNAVALSADGRRLLTGSGKHVARWWDVDAGTLLHTLSSDSGAHWSTPAAVSPDGRRAAYGSVTGGGTDIAVYDTETGKLAQTLVGHQRGLRKLAFSADGLRLASAGFDDTVRVWDIATGQEVLWRLAPRNVVDLGFSRDGKRLSAVAADGTLRTWGGG